MFLSHNRIDVFLSLSFSAFLSLLQERKKKIRKYELRPGFMYMHLT